MRASNLIYLSRWHRPTGAWLLAAPCLIGIVFARLGQGVGPADIVLAAVFVVGAVAMRGAGCTYNDMLDRRLDAGVARTRARPLACGEVSMLVAGLWVLIQCLAGLAVLLCLPPPAQLTAVVSLPLVVLYPLMKRLTSLPQFWLGITFNWGVLVAVVSVAGAVRLADVIAYLALVAWTVGYDTIYAIQDAADDARVGIGSTARLLGVHAPLGVAVSYGVSVCGLMLACWLAGSSLAVWAVTPFAVCLIWQVWRLDPGAPDRAGVLFASNGLAAGALIAMWAATGLIAAS